MRWRAGQSCAPAFNKIMALDFPIIRRQRTLGAFPTADAMRAAKSLQTATPSVTLDPILPATTPVVKPVKVSPPNPSHDDAADK